MNNDQALRKSLNRKKDELPYGFDQRVMRQIQQETERNSRVSYYRGLVLVSLVSAGLLVGLYYTVNLFFGLDFLLTIQQLTLPSFGSLSPYGQSLFSFCLFIAILMLVLLGLDHVFRTKFGKTVKK